MPVASSHKTLTQKCAKKWPTRSTSVRNIAVYQSNQHCAFISSRLQRLHYCNSLAYSISDVLLRRLHVVQKRFGWRSRLGGSTSLWQSSYRSACLDFRRVLSITSFRRVSRTYNDLRFYCADNKYSYLLTYLLTYLLAYLRLMFWCITDAGIGDMLATEERGDAASRGRKRTLASSVNWSSSQDQRHLRQSYIVTFLIYLI